MFNVNDEVEIENIDEVKKTKTLIPVSANVLLDISKVVADVSKDKQSKTLNVSFKLSEGVEVEGEIKYKGSMASSFPQRYTYWVSTEKVQDKIANAEKKSTREWYKNKQYLVEMKSLLLACGLKAADFTVEGKLNVDALISAIKGQQVIGNITQKEDEAFDKSTGKNVKLGTFQNEVKNLRKVQ